jgi:hypothetical protein
MVRSFLHQVPKIHHRRGLPATTDLYNTYIYIYIYLRCYVPVDRFLYSAVLPPPPHLDHSSAHVIIYYIPFLLRFRLLLLILFFFFCWRDFFSSFLFIRFYSVKKKKKKRAHRNVCLLFSLPDIREQCTGVGSILCAHCTPRVVNVIILRRPIRLLALRKK